MLGLVCGTDFHFHLNSVLRNIRFTQWRICSVLSPLGPYDDDDDDDGPPEHGMCPFFLPLLFTQTPNSLWVRGQRSGLLA